MLYSNYEDSNFNPKDSFTSDQQQILSSIGQVTYTKTREALPVEKLLEMARDADIIGCDPDPLGGFEKAKEKLSKIVSSLPDLKGICLSTTSFGWVDLGLCKKKIFPLVMSLAIQRNLLLNKQLLSY